MLLLEDTTNTYPEDPSSPEAQLATGGPFLHPLSQVTSSRPSVDVSTTGPPRSKWNHCLTLGSGGFPASRPWSCLSCARGGTAAPATQAASDARRDGADTARRTRACGSAAEQGGVASGGGRASRPGHPVSRTRYGLRLQPLPRGAGTGAPAQGVRADDKVQPGPAA